MLNIRFEIWRQPLNFYVSWPWHSTQNTCPWKTVEYLSNNYISKSSLTPFHVYLETVIRKFINLVKINSNFGPIFFRMKTSDGHFCAVLLQGQVQRQPYQNIYLETVFFWCSISPNKNTKSWTLSVCLFVCFP